LPKTRGKAVRIELKAIAEDARQAIRIELKAIAEDARQSSSESN
jgi:ribosome recycling factor